MFAGPKMTSPASASMVLSPTVNRALPSVRLGAAPADPARSVAVLAGVALDIEHRAAENRILGPGGTPGNLPLLGHTLPLILPGQPLLLAFFPPVVCERVMLSSALRRMASERAWSVTTRETVSAPIRVNA